MKIVILVRHAKSSKDDPALADFERPLNDRGRRDAPMMAQRLQRAGLAPDLLVSSPALRAITTAHAFADVLRIGHEKISVQPRLYNASAGEILRVLQTTDERATEAWLFAHNPGISEAALRLAECPFDQMPTCACARIELKVKLWSEVLAGCGRLTLFSYPKQEEA